MKRRVFLLTAAAAASVILFPIFNHKRKISRNSDPLLLPDVLTRFCDEKTIRKIGDQYLLHAPSEAEIVRLKKLILTDESGAILQLSDRAGLSKWISEKISHDFAVRKTLIVDGWILSETEARQCAFYSLFNR